MDYVIYCTKEQTDRAIKLGAPFLSPEDYEKMTFPTAEQMCGWMREEKDICIDVYQNALYMSGFDSGFKKYVSSTGLPDRSFYQRDTYKEAISKAIDSALEYLEKGE